MASLRTDWATRCGCVGDDGPQPRGPYSENPDQGLQPCPGTGCKQTGAGKRVQGAAVSARSLTALNACVMALDKLSASTHQRRALSRPRSGWLAYGLKALPARVAQTD